ncbi:sensor histidine kinase [Pseudoduganella chitinolytica]|uniref:Histidine kinase n=1 Tax=Pseudoduganella chitinolytica TaxID=34070 RepID=A0ABY8B5J9_9BURK|nr:histidine kinase [Pseudoduganella chitinolytica]WEF31016.1 histidine kinase [Pseudoduganella chitinolytica]
MPHSRLLLRLRGALACAFVASLPLALIWDSAWALWLRAGLLATAGVCAFSLLEHWPRRLPAWLARWALQVGAVALAMPLTTVAIYLSLTASDVPFWQAPERRLGFGLLTVLGTLLAPWIALAALVRQKDALARHQALAFDLERSELARQASDARLHLLQAQVAPHFLFNTLANVQALVDAQAPQAPALLRSLTAYLRAAVPQLHEPAATLGHELALVRAYLDLMRMRMPDRLQFGITADAALHRLRCPAMTLLTLVENAVRHGIDPAEDGGRIDIAVFRTGDRCIASVSDTGVGMGPGSGGTGLATLRERLALQFGGAAHVRLYPVAPHGVRAEIEFPALEETA